MSAEAARRFAGDAAYVQGLLPVLAYRPAGCRPRLIVFSGRTRDAHVTNARIKRGGEAGRSGLSSRRTFRTFRSGATLEAGKDILNCADDGQRAAVCKIYLRNGVDLRMRYDTDPRLLVYEAD
jgi:hypothetical protein